MGSSQSTENCRLPHPCIIVMLGGWSSLIYEPNCVSDERLLAQIQQVWQDSLQVYGYHKVWHQLQHQGVHVARCTVARLMSKHRIWWSGSSLPVVRISCGWPISPMWPPIKALCIPHSSPTFLPAVLWAGKWPNEWTRIWLWMHWSKLCTLARTQTRHSPQQQGQSIPVDSLYRAFTDRSIDSFEQQATLITTLGQKR